MVDACVSCTCVDATTGVSCNNARKQCNVTCDENQELKYSEDECCPVCGEFTFERVFSVRSKTKAQVALVSIANKCSR